MENRERNHRRKHNRKSKISDLDEKEVNKRRAQGRLAQRVSRQRKGETLALLERQVLDLQNTVDGAIFFFLTLAGDLTASGWLRNDAHTATAVKESIESFISLMRASQVLNENQEGETQSPQRDTKEEDVESRPGSILPRQHSTPDRNTIIGPGSASANITPGSDGSLPPAIPLQFMVTRVGHFNTVYLPRSPLNEGALNFAQQLHLKAFQNAFSIIQSAGQRWQDFQRVFNCNPSYEIQELFLRHVTKVLGENSAGLLEPPKEPEPNPLAHTYSGWLNATQIMLSFREQGVDLNISAKFVYLEDKRRSHADDACASEK